MTYLHQGTVGDITYIWALLCDFGHMYLCILPVSLPVCLTVSLSINLVIYLFKMYQSSFDLINQSSKTVFL